MSDALCSHCDPDIVSTTILVTLLLLVRALASPMECVLTTVTSSSMSARMSFSTHISMLMTTCLSAGAIL